MADAEESAAGMHVPADAIDDQTAVKVTDCSVEVVSEGHWKLLTPNPEQASRARETRGRPGNARGNAPGRPAGVPD